MFPICPSSKESHLIATVRRNEGISLEFIVITLRTEYLGSSPDVYGS